MKFPEDDNPSALGIPKSRFLISFLCSKNCSIDIPLCSSSTTIHHLLLRHFQRMNNFDRKFNLLVELELKSAPFLKSLNNTSLGSRSFTSGAILGTWLAKNRSKFSQSTLKIDFF